MSINCTTTLWIRIYGSASIVCSAYEMLMVSVIRTTNPNCPKVKIWRWAFAFLAINCAIGSVSGLLSLLIRGDRNTLGRSFHICRVLSLLSGIACIVLHAVACDQAANFKCTTEGIKTTSCEICKEEPTRVFVLEEVFLFLGFLLQMIIVLSPCIPLKLCKDRCTNEDDYGDI